MKKLLAFVLAIACLCGVCAAESYTFAVIGPMTGAAAIYGTAAANGAQIAVNQINAKAGEEVITLIIEDDVHDAEIAMNAYNTALDNGAQAIIGTVTSTPCKAVSEKAYEDRVFMLTPSASDPDVTADKDNCYQLCFSDPTQGNMSAHYILDNNLGSTIGVIYNNGDTYSTGIYRTFTAEMEANGVTVACVQAFNDSNATDFTVQVAAMKEAGCDLVFLPTYYTPNALILKTANDMEYSPLFFGVDGMDGILTLEGFDTSLAEGVMLLTPFAADATDELTSTFVSEYVAAYGETPIQFAADGYDCVYAMYEAFLKAGLEPDTAAEDCCDALIEVFSGDFEVTGVTGVLNWESTGEVAKVPFAAVIKNGVYTTPEF